MPTSGTRSTSYRSLLLAIAVGNLAFAAGLRLDGGVVSDPVSVRLAVSALAAAAAAATYHPAARRAGRLSVYAVAHLLVVYGTVLWVLNGFSLPYALSYLALAAALALGGAATATNWRALTGMMAAALLWPLAALAWRTPPDAGRATFVLGLFTVTLVAVFTARSRAHARARLGAERARYRSVFDGATDGIYLADTHSRRIADANPAMLRLTGYSLTEIRALRIDDLVHVESGEQSVAENVSAARTTGTDLVAQRRLRTAAGQLVHVEVSGTVLDLGDGAETISLLVRDATERRATEDVLRRAAGEADTARAHAEEMLALKSSFLANMSHEIRTPLTGILGYTDLLADEVSGDARAMVGAVHRGAVRLMATLNSVLDLARLDADASPLPTEPVDLAALAAEAVLALMPAAAARGLALAAPAGAPVWALADAGAVGRILDNLVGNALKFTDAGTVSVVAGVAGGCATLTVRDTGAGIPPAFLPHLFDEFRQASDGHGRTHEGSGLGLALTKRLVDRLGGEIAVETAAGVGTAFTVSLPAAAPEELPAAARRHSALVA